MEKVRKFLYIIRFIPIAFFVNWNDKKMVDDLKRWKSVLNLNISSDFVLVAVLLGSIKEFRNLFIYRNKERMLFKRWIALFYKPMESLAIDAAEIGGGLFIQHGIATIISAKSIGENCWINQQVTIGYRGNSKSAPVIGDNVYITCGAKVLGDIYIGNNSIIAANAVVIRDVEPDSVMGGVPAKKLK